MAGQQVFHYSIPVLQDTGDGQLEDGSTIDSAKILIHERCVLVSKLNPRKGTVCIAVPQAGVLTVGSGELIPLIPQEGLVEYVHYVVQSATYRDRLASLVESATRSHQRASVDDVLKFNWAFPALAEQHQIVCFLDRETAKIDALIAEQERLIALLQEKRQAVISHAVTKGLDPNVPMKESGIEWLGQIPSHWLSDRLKRFCELRTSNVDKKTVEGQAEVRLCNYTDVYYNDLIVSTLPFMVATATESQIERLSLKAHDVVITKDSETADDIARSAYVPESLDGVVCGYHLAVLRPGAEADGLFVKYCFDGALAKAQVEVESNGLTRVALGQYSIDNLVWPWPPLAEQRAIASFINAQCKAADAAMADAGRTVSLLRERRTAIITAVVTGQIDVRGLTEAAA